MNSEVESAFIRGAACALAILNRNHDQPTMVGEALIDEQVEAKLRVAADLAKARELLAMLYDKWENGDPCYQDGDVECDYLGNAFKLGDDEENQILALLASKAGEKT